jgi:hypothetical protein
MTNYQIPMTENGDSGAVEKPSSKEIFTINLPSLDGRGLRGG